MSADPVWSNDLFMEKQLLGFMFVGFLPCVVACTASPWGWVTQESFNRPSQTFSYNQFNEGNNRGRSAFSKCIGLPAVPVDHSGQFSDMVADSTYWQAAIGKSIWSGWRTSKWKQMRRADRYRCMHDFKAIYQLSERSARSKLEVMLDCGKKKQVPRKHLWVWCVW